MARSLRSLILCSVCVVFGVQAFAEPPAATPPVKKGRKEQDATPAPASPEFENVRKALNELTPEQRKRFQENFKRWNNLAPEEKTALRDREELRKKFMEQDVQAAIQESGLQLDADGRARFIQRYAQERRKIEEQLRKETNEKRKPLVIDMVARLKAEFSGETVAQPAATPSPASEVAPLTPAKP